MKPVNCGCGGEAKVDKQTTLDGDGQEIPCWVVYCTNCLMVTDAQFSESEAIEAWNLAMGKRTAKVESLVLTSYPSQTVWKCGECGKLLLGQVNYCPICGARLEWK